MTALLASSTDWHDHGWIWFWPFATLLWFAALVLAARFVFRRGHHAAPAGPDARAILAERYARGEIEHDEYRERLGHLEER